MKIRGGIGSWIVMTISIIICCSCAITRHIPEDQLLIRSVRIEQNESTPKDERISTSTLERYVRQSSNKRLLGFNFYLWMHYLANPDKSNWWNDLKRKIGEEPSYLDLSLTERSKENLNIYMDSQGFYSSTAEYEIDTLDSRRRARVVYKTHQGRPYIINDLRYDFQDATLRQVILPDTTNTLIQRGDIFSVALLDEERERITARLRNQGYFDFTVQNIEYRADTLAGNYTVDLEMIIKKNLAGYNERGIPQYRDNIKYRIGEVTIQPNYNPTTQSTALNKIDTMHYRGLNIIYSGSQPNVRTKVLRQMVPLESGTLYNSQNVDQTYQNLMSLGYFKSARINFRPEDIETIKGDSSIMLRVNRQHQRAGIDTSIDSLNEGFISSHILCTPALKQSYDIQIEGSTTSSFYGLYATLGYQNRNIFRGAEAWNIDLTMGYEHMKAPDAIKKRATEVGVSTGLSFPRFILPIANGVFPRIVQPKTSVEVSVNFQDRPYYNRNLSSASLSYSWRNRRYSSFTLRPFDINVIDMNYIDENYFESLTNDYLRNSYETQLTAGINLGYIYNNQRKDLKGNYTTLRINSETSGNFINLMENMFSAPNSDGYYEIFHIRYAQYFRSDISISQRVSTGGKTAIAGRIFAGAGWAYGNSTSLPFDRLFYSGGSNSMRGWTPRTLGPGSTEEVTDSVYPSQLGDMKLEANLELRFPIWDNLHGATFVDVGNIWYIKNSEGIYDQSEIFCIKDFYKQLGFNTGFGLRLDIQFAVLRLDWGVQLYNPNKGDSERWVIKKFNFSNTALNFGVGYPF